MRRFLSAAAAAAALVWGAPVSAQTPAAAAPVDYSQAASWLCRPEAMTNCIGDFGALVVDAAGNRTPQPFQAAADPGVDCFYVYPTVSRDLTDYSDMIPGPEEIAVAKSHAGRFASRCRVYVPMYRQMTMTALTKAMNGSGGKLDWDPPYADVRAAWRQYLAHDNHGRGVILIGHSQGTIILSRLLAEEIDGKPTQKLLVSALLAGHPGFGVPAGKDVGGTLKAIPLCRKTGQTGCVVVWSTYTVNDDSAHRIFGANPAPGQVGACVNPAALAGGKANLKSYFRKPSVAPAEDPPYVELIGQLSGECVTDAQGSVLRISLEESKFKDLLQVILTRGAVASGWGLHPLDVPLTLGDLLDLTEAQSKAWIAARH